MHDGHAGLAHFALDKYQAFLAHTHQAKRSARRSRPRAGAQQHDSGRHQCRGKHFALKGFQRPAIKDDFSSATARCSTQSCYRLIGHFAQTLPSGIRLYTRVIVVHSRLGVIRLGTAVNKETINDQGNTDHSSNR